MKTLLCVVVLALAGCASAVDCDGQALSKPLGACNDQRQGKWVCASLGDGYVCNAGCWKRMLDGPCALPLTTDAGTSCPEGTTVCGADAGATCSGGIEFTCSRGCATPTDTCE